MMLLMLVRSAVSLYVTRCSKHILLRHLPSKPPSRLSVSVVVLHVSEADSSTGQMSDVYIFSFVLVWRILDFQMLVSLLKACAADPY